MLVQRLLRSQQTRHVEQRCLNVGQRLRRWPNILPTLFNVSSQQRWSYRYINPRLS